MSPLRRDRIELDVPLGTVEDWQEAGCEPIQIRIDEARRLGRLLRVRRVDELKRVQLAVAHDKTDPDRFPR